MTLNRDDAARLSDLRDQHELAELTILTATPKSVLPIVADRDSLTIGQTLILVDFLRGMAKLRDLVPGSFGADNGPVFGQAETRDSSPYSYGGENTDPYGADSAEEAWQNASPEQRQAAVDKVKALFANVFDNEPMADTVNGPIRVSDIPRDESGDPDQEWVNANCNCPDHRAQREQATVTLSEQPSEDWADSRPGLYV